MSLQQDQPSTMGSQASASPAQGRPTTLIDLPTEILTHICAQLCHHCSDHEPAHSIRWPDISTTRYDESCLPALSLVCSRLRCIAQPILFHSFRFQELTANRTLRERLSPFLRTLYERKDLRHHVRHLDIDNRNTQCTCCYPYYPPNISKEEKKVVSRLCKETGLSLHMESFDYNEVEETVMQVALTLLPDLTEVRFLIPRAWKFELLSSWRWKGRSIGEKSRPFLASIRRMLLQIDEKSNETCFDGHGKCNRPIPDSPVEEVLIDASPHLELLCCTASGLKNTPALSRLTHLQIMMRGSWQGKLDKLIRGLPRLTHFSSWSTNEHSPPPREIQAALSPVQDTLEYLSIGYWKHFMAIGPAAEFTYPWGGNGLWQPPRSYDFVLDSLAGFTNLKGLILDDFMIWSDSSGCPTSNYHTNRRCRDHLDFLPDSIESVFIENSVGSPLPLQPLAVSLTKGRKKNLSRVIWFEDELAGPCFLDSRDRHRKDWLQETNWRKELRTKGAQAVLRSQYMAFPDLSILAEQIDRHGS